MQIKEYIKKIIPSVFVRIYHYGLALSGAIAFGFPSRRLTVIGVTGTSGKSTTVDFIAKILEEDGIKTASLSSIRFKMGQKEWRNNLKMTMPGRFRIQKFLMQAVKENCKYAVLEVTSEGIRQYRHKFINFDTAVFTNLSPEHIESHGSFENYRNEKLKLFKATENFHIINIDDENSKYFLEITSQKKIAFGITCNSKVNSRQFLKYRENIIFIESSDIQSDKNGLLFKIKDIVFRIPLLGEFNAYNALAAISVATAYGISLENCKKALEKVRSMPGRMEIVSKNPLVIVDYAHTPDQLEKVYQNFYNWSENSKFQIPNSQKTSNFLDQQGLSKVAFQISNLICVLGSCGGGRDKWKRPVLGQIAQKYCREIILTNEDPYDEQPLSIINEIESGCSQIQNSKSEIRKIIDRKEAIKKSLHLAKSGDTIVITGKGSESLMCIEKGKKIPWDDRQIVREILKNHQL